MPVIREIGPYQEEPKIKEIGPYQASQSIREIGPHDDSKAIREIGPLRPEKKPRPAPSFMELQQGFGVLPAIGLKAVQGAATAIDKVFGDTEAEKEQQRRDTSGAMIEESTPANIALGLAGAKGLSMLTKTPFAPVREAVEAVTQIPMPWKGKAKAQSPQIDVPAEFAPKTLAKEADVGKTDWMTNIVTGQDKTLREFESGVNGAIPKEAVTRATQKDLASKITENEQSLAQLLAKKPADGFSAVDQVALADIGDKTLKDIADHAIAEGWDSTMFREAQDRIFGQVAIARTEAGRALEANKYKLASRRLQSAFGKLNRGLNEREQNEFLDLIKMGALDDPRAVKRFAARLGDPKKMDYVWEYWYNSILSGIPTHIVNTLSNTMWQAWQVPHGALTAGIDKAMSVFRGGKREYLLKEVIPSWAGVKTGFTKGRKGAWEMVRTGKTTEWESKIDADIGGAIISAFERSPNKILKKAAPYVTWPSRFLGASDVWFKSIAFDSKLAALARAKGITPDKASKEMIDQASDYARYVTFTDEPGKIASFLVGMRDNPEHPLAGGLMRLIMPFVSTPGNLLKRGLEMTPGIGLLAKGRQPIQEVAAKQIEGAVIAAALFAKIDKGEITGPAPINKAEREIFYANGKLPWAVKVGDKWMQYRRIEPFNMPVAMAAVAYEQIKNAKSEEEASKVAWNVVNGIKEHVIDSSYLQGVQNLLSPQGKLEGAAQRTLASFVPMSSFNRSINRAIESGVEGAARPRDTKSLAGAFSQVIPGGYSWTEPKLDVLGQPQQIQGGPARQFFPYKYGEEGGTPITQELDRLGVYPGHAEQSITIGGVKKKLDNGVYRDYQERLGQRIEERINRVMSMPGYATAPDERKAKMIKRAIQSARDIELKKLKREYKYRKNMMELED